MINSILIYFISFLFFSINHSLLDWSDYNYGDILKLENSQYFSEKIKQVKEPEISASSAVVMDVRKNIFILEKNSEQIWPIASISKIMSALVLLEDLNVNLDDYYQVKASDRRVGGRDYLFIGDEISNRDLLALSLVASDNTAIIAMISSLQLSEEEFVDLMNDKAKKLKLEKTRFEDATGLNSSNVSTAKEVSLLLNYAFNNRDIIEFVKQYEYKIITKQGRVSEIQSTNELLNGFYSDSSFKIIGGKTGYNDLAGYCLGTKFSLLNNQEFISVVLNASSLKNRFIDTKKLLDEVTNFYNN